MLIFRSSLSGSLNGRYNSRSPRRYAATPSIIAAIRSSVNSLGFTASSPSCAAFQSIALVLSQAIPDAFAFTRHEPSTLRSLHRATSARNRKFWSAAAPLPLLLHRTVPYCTGALYFVTSLLHSSFVFSKSRKVDSEQELYDIAIRALTRRSHSVGEMKKLLSRRADSELLAQLVMARLKETGKLDDARYARQFVRRRTEIRRQGAYRIARDLRARGVPDRHIDAALKSAASENAGTSSDEAALIRHRIQRKLKLLSGEIDDKKIASLYRSLLRAGFSADAVRRQLKSLTSAELADGDSSESG